MARLDETIAIGQSGHISDHDQIVARLNDEYYDVLNEYAGDIQTAIDAAAAAGGGVVYMGPGTYALGGTGVTIDYINGAGYAGVHLIGAGVGNTTLTYTGAGPAIFWGSTETALSNPRNMGSLGGFTVDGPGKGTANSKGITITQVAYALIEDILVIDSETAFNFDCSPDGGTGTSGTFGTGTECRKLRTFDCKKGFWLHDSGAPHVSSANDNEWTDMRFFNCYANSGYGTTLQAGTIGFYVERGNTNQFIACSQEAFEVGLQLGNTAGTGQASRNGFYYFRDEISGGVSAATFHETGIIYQGDDNVVLGTKGTIRDYTADQANVIIAKRDTNRSSTLYTVHRLVRTLDSVWDNSGSITSGLKVLTTPNGIFQAQDVGRNIWISGAGVAGAVLATTITAYTSATQVTVNTAASTTVSGTARILCQATLPTAASSQAGNLLYEERQGAADRLVFYSQNSSDTAIKTDILTATAF